MLAIQKRHRSPFTTPVCSCRDATLTPNLISFSLTYEQERAPLEDAAADMVVSCNWGGTGAQDQQLWERDEHCALHQCISCILCFTRIVLRFYVYRVGSTYDRKARFWSPVKSVAPLLVARDLNWACLTIVDPCCALLYPGTVLNAYWSSSKVVSTVVFLYNKIPAVYRKQTLKTGIPLKEGELNTVV